MPSLSLIIITKNEAHNLARCIESVPFADEIIVVDSQSTDGTQRIARTFTDKVFDLPWSGFGPAKQAALDRATCDWVLSLDADEALDSDLAQSIRAILEQEGSPPRACRVNRLSNFLGRWIRHSGWYPDRIVRLGPRKETSFTASRVHEKMIVQGPVSDLNGHLLHRGAPELGAYLRKSQHYANLLAQSSYEKGKTAGWLDLCFRPVYKFCLSYIVRQGFRDGMPGLILAGVSAYYVFWKYARIWELNHPAMAHSETPDCQPKESREN